MKNAKRIITGVIVVFIVNSAFAQKQTFNNLPVGDSSALLNKNYSIQKFKGKYVANNHCLTKNYLNDLIVAHPDETIKMNLTTDYNVWRSEKKKSRNLFITGSSILVAGITTAIIVDANAPKEEVNTANQKTTTTDGTVSAPIVFNSLGLGIGAFVMSAKFNMKAKKTHTKIIDAYNQDLPGTLPVNLQGSYELSYLTGMGETRTATISKIQPWGRGLGFRHYYTDDMIIKGDKELKIKLDAFPDQKIRLDLIRIYEKKRRYVRNERISYAVGVAALVPAALMSFSNGMAAFGGQQRPSDAQIKDTQDMAVAGAVVTSCAFITGVSFKIGQKACQKEITKRYNNE